jgi:hypothetical protein
MVTSAALLFRQNIHLAPRLQFCIFLVVVLFLAAHHYVMVLECALASAVASVKDVEGEAHLDSLVIVWRGVIAGLDQGFESVQSLDIPEEGQD